MDKDYFECNLSSDFGVPLIYIYKYIYSYLYQCLRHIALTTYMKTNIGGLHHYGGRTMQSPKIMNTKLVNQL